MRTTAKEFFLIIFVMAAIHIYLLVRCRHAITPMENWHEDTPRNVAYYLDLEVKNLPENFCNNPTTLLIFVHSQPKNKEARAAIRRTWGNQTHLTKYNTSLFFLLGEGKNLSTRDITKEENLQYRDVIVEDFIDNYANLTLKSVTMLKLFQNQDKCKFLMKADEDLFVNLENLLKILRYLHGVSREKLLMGRVITGERRKNNYYKKWYAPRYMFLRHKYPPFLAGPAYVMTLKVARALYGAALELPLFHLEDVFLTGICAEKVGIRRWYMPMFTDFGMPKKKCHFLRMISGHSFTPKKLERAQELFNQAKHDPKCALQGLYLNFV